MEFIGGRASRTGVYDLMGISLKDYEDIFEEKFDLLLKLNEEKIVNWRGKFRPELKDAEILPRPYGDKLVIRRGVGGTPASAIKAGYAGVPMTLATLAGPSSACKPAVDAYRLALTKNGYNPAEFPVGTTSLSYVAEDTETALREYYPYLNNGFQILRGGSFPKYNFAEAENPKNALMAGGWELVAEKILYQHELYGHQRFLAQIDFGGMPLSKVEKVIDLLANKVAPIVKQATKK